MNHPDNIEYDDRLLDHYVGTGAHLASLARAVDSIPSFKASRAGEVEVAQAMQIERTLRQAAELLRQAQASAAQLTRMVMAR